MVRSIIIIITPKYHYIILLYNAPLDYINIRSLGHSRLLGSRAHPYHPEPLTLNKDVSKRSINIMRSYLALEKKVIVDGSKIPQIVPVNRVEEPSMLKKLWEIGGSAMKLILISILIPPVLPWQWACLGKESYGISSEYSFYSISRVQARESCFTILY